MSEAFPIEKLTLILADHPSGDFEQEEKLAGLAATLKQLIKEAPLRFCFSLSEFIHLDGDYICSVIDAYTELWNEKANLPWDEIWNCLLNFCRSIVNSDKFWSEENSHPPSNFVANRKRIIRAIGRLLEDGAKADAHAFHQRHHGEVETLLARILQKQKGEIFTESTDAVFVAINSPRGKCLEALINLTLRSCRLSDRENKSMYKHGSTSSITTRPN